MAHRTCLPVVATLAVSLLEASMTSVAAAAAAAKACRLVTEAPVTTRLSSGPTKVGQFR